MGFLSDIVKGAGSIAGIAGGFGAGEDQPSRTEQQSGFRTQPDKVKELMLGDVYNRIRGYMGQSNPYGSLRTSLTAEDLDPTFGSKPRANYAGNLMGNEVRRTEQGNVPDIAEILKNIRGAATQKDAWRWATILSNAQAAELMQSDRGDIQKAYDEVLSRNNWRHVR